MSTRPDKMVPHSVPIEESCLGSLLIDPNAYYKVAGNMTPELFYIQKNGWIFSVIKDLNELRRPVDFVTVCDELERRGQFDEIGGAAYVTRMINAVPSAMHVTDYAQSLRDYWLRRATLTDASALAQLAYDEGNKIGEERARMGQLLLTGANLETEPVSVRTAAERVYARAERFANEKLPVGAVRGMSMGMPALDRLFRGIERAFYVFGATTSTGKTAVCMYAAYALALQGYRVLYFTLEMPATNLLERMVCSLAQIPRDDYQCGLEGARYAAFLEWVAHVAELPILFYDNCRSMTKINAEVHRASMTGPIDLIVVDPGNLVKGAKREATHEKLGEITAFGLQLAQTPSINAAVFMTQQISFKSLKMRDDKEPRPEDLYASDEPHQNTDELVLLHRADRYETDPAKFNNLMKLAYWKSRVKTLPQKWTDVRFLLGMLYEPDSRTPPVVFDENENGEQHPSWTKEKFG